MDQSALLHMVLTASFSINQIEYTITENDDYSSTSRLPEFSENHQIFGNGKIQDLKSLSTGSMAVLGNASGNLTFEGIELSPSGERLEIHLFIRRIF